MKKHILLLLFLLLATTYTSFAQYSRFGAKVGGGFATIKGNDAPSATISNKAVLHAGLVYAYDFFSALAIQTELQYSRKGFIYNDYQAGQNEVYAGDVYLDYIELPLLLRIQKTSLFLEAGPYIGYLFNAGSDVNRIRQNSSGLEPTVIGQQNFGTSDFQKIDYGYAVGAGFVMDNRFFLTVRNTGGLRSVSRQDLTQRNMVWQLSLGFLMPIGRQTTF